MAPACANLSVSPLDVDGLGKFGEYLHNYVCTHTHTQRESEITRWSYRMPIELNQTANLKETHLFTIYYIEWQAEHNVPSGAWTNFEVGGGSVPRQAPIFLSWTSSAKHWWGISSYQMAGGSSKRAGGKLPRRHIVCRITPRKLVGHVPRPPCYLVIFWVCLQLVIAILFWK